MDSIRITYKFIFADGRAREHEVRIERKTLANKQVPAKQAHSWTALDNAKCEHCPLNAKDHPECPVARNLADVADDFKNEKSYDKVDVEVITAERTYKRSLPLQEGLFGIFGLIMATSACPHMEFLRPMARFHLPFSSLEETMVRSTSFYLLRQYFVAKRGGKPDFELAEFAKLYSQVETVNMGIIQRIRTISKGDADANSIIALDGYAKLLGFHLSDGLSDLERLFFS